MRSRSVCSRLLDSALPAEKCCKLFDRDACLADQRTKRALRHFAVVRNREPAKRSFSMAKDDMTALLPIDFIPEPAEGSDCFMPRDPR
jgi:hypothetical protein